MRIAWTLLAYLVALVGVAAVSVVGVLFLAGPHAGLLPAPLESLVVVAAGLAVLVVPIVVALRVWNRRSPTRAQTGAPDGAAPRDLAALCAGIAAPAIQLVRAESRGRSHLGGTPALPADRTWPQWRGRPLDFLARLSLAELQATLPIDWLPRAGTLLFFYDVENQPWGFDPADGGSCAVLHVPDDEGPAPSAPARPEVCPRIDVTFRRIATLPSQEREPTQDLRLTDAERDAYEDLRDAVHGSHPKHQVGGFPFPVQGDGMELECQLASNGLYCGDTSAYRDPRAQALAPGARDWRLLLQFDSDDGAGLMWGDCGTLYVWVREQDAAQGRFDAAWLILQCS